MTARGDPAWRWPDRGQNSDRFLRDLEHVQSPYRQEPPAFCYPGTRLGSSHELTHRLVLLAHEHINMIGMHTDHGGEGGFDLPHLIEARVISMIAGMVGGNLATVAGFFCEGGTRANEQGMYLGREYLDSLCPESGIAVLVTPLAHYSVTKSAKVLQIGRLVKATCDACGRPHRRDAVSRGLFFIGMNEAGEMDPGSLLAKLTELAAEGIRKFMVVATAGTTLMGSIDPVEQIGAVLERFRTATGAHTYLHVDAAFGGFTIPFVAGGKVKIGFDVPEVQSMTIDGHKMGQLPYGSGIFLSRKELFEVVADHVQYVGGHLDNTLPGSRSFLPAAEAWVLYNTLGIEGQRRYVQHCLDARDRLAMMIEVRLRGRVTVLPFSPYVNQLPVEFHLNGGEIPQELLQGVLRPYEMRCDYFPTDPGDPESCPRTVYKVCVMPHTVPYLDHFVNDLGRALSMQAV